MQNFLRPHPIGDRIHRLAEIQTAAGDGKVGWIDTRNIAATAATLLLDAHGYRDRNDYLLTGPRGLSYQDAADVITARTGRTISVHRVTFVEPALEYQEAGMPAELAAALVSVESGSEEPGQG